MQTLAQQLPPLEALVAFESAARHSSFTLAAEELNLTQAAVSQRIRNLELALGQKLFDRRHRAVRLNSFGREYQHTVSMALLHLASATRNISPAVTLDKLTIAADEASAALWLMPRLSGFYSSHSRESIRLIVSDNLEECLAPTVDAAIVFGGEGATGFVQHQLFQESVFPVCSPGYLAANPQITRIERLGEADLIDLEDNRWDWLNWQIWLTEKKIAYPAGGRGIQIGSYPMVIEAAKYGMGVALGWAGLVDDLIASGELVVPVKECISTTKGYNLFVRKSPGRHLPAEHFEQWVLNEAGSGDTATPEKPETAHA